MIKEYRFKDIEKYLKKDTEIGKDVLEAFESLTDVAIIFSPIIFGPQLLPILNLLDVKDRLFELGHKVYDFISQKVELDYIDRMEQIRAAYALICYTAYFDVFQDAIPKAIRKKLKLNFEMKRKMLEKSIETSDTTISIPTTTQEIYCNVYYADHVTSFSDIKEQLIVIYTNITDNLIKIIIESTVFNEENKKEEHELENLKEKLNKLPQRAIGVYEAQYINLADHFNDFALFAQLKNFEKLNYSISRNKNALDFLVDTTKKIDVGLSNLNNIVNSIVTNYSAIQVQDIVDDLKTKYIATIEESIIDDKEIKSETETMSLRFPRIVDAFIPQSYKCFSYQNKDTKLEDMPAWKQLPTQNDLDRFFIKYLYSPDSIDFPLIILGQPGSGKSLLTKVLSAQLMSNSYTVIRIPLREINAEDGIDILVEDQIKKITNRPLSTQGYGGFATQFNEKPLVIILDGYDELLQAKGDVFSGYLEKVRTFQQDQKLLKRPVRIIVTSRITLIDKARIPINSTILRLMEFNAEQRQTWIDIWNNINVDYFTSSHIKPFSLPSKERGKKNSIIELAEQPLLLLMLALYDSEANELAKTSNIKRTELYDNLLRRFVRRERGRYVPGFADKTPNEQEIIIDQEMNRLGVVAIGMYNRKGVVILSRQLEKDLDTFSARRDDGSPKLHTLKESESVLGGFFFIHKSIAKDNDAHSDNSESAYEFLHNTFGEFLAADFILRNTINEVKDIFVDRQFKSTGLTNKLSNPDSLNPGWFNCLMFVPLYSRPVVIEMLREHMTKALQRALKIYNISINFTQDNFIDNLKFLVKNQLRMILNTRNTPSVMRGDILLDQDIPLLGYLSTYSLNLIILACSLSSNGFEFDEEEYLPFGTSVQDSRPWDKLISLWKVWFSPADLMGLSVILKANRKNDTVISIECNEKFEATRYEYPIDILLCVSFTLADNLLAGLSGIQTPRFREITRMSDEKICEMLRGENFDLYFTYLLSLLREQLDTFSDGWKRPRDIKVNYEKVNEIIEIIIRDSKFCFTNKDTLLNILEVFEYCLIRKIVFFETRVHIMEALAHLFNEPKSAFKKISRTAMTRLLKLLIRNKDFILLEKYDGPFYEYEYINEKWSEEMDLFIRYMFRNMKEDIHFFEDFNEGNTYKMELLDITEGLFSQRKEDERHVLKHYLSLDSIQILLQTNPELLSSILISLLKNEVLKGKEINRIVDVYLKGCLNLLKSVGMGYIEFNVIINAISIAHYTKATWFLNKMRDILHNQIFCRHPRFFGTLIYLYPDFIANLIEGLPEVFPNNFHVIFDIFPFEKEILHVKATNMLDYIKIFRYLYQHYYDKEINTEVMIMEWQRGMRMFERMIVNAFNLNRIDFACLTMGQIDDLTWYANYVGNAHIMVAIERALHRHTNL